MQLTQKQPGILEQESPYYRDPAFHLVRRHFRRSGYYARDLSFNFFGWPFAFYMAAQGSLIIYVDHHLVLRALHEQPGPRLRRP